ncbi:hypothetical protein EA472_05675 [Natrarchaeobius oligotrophus]|uniref:Uncharacterized protein n=1 Tax=Natrarchaeobius chitinivorans TaxID=1679083 RepID=A0A3N6N2F0_NATCH|nr:hypothetical protein [Natrarchaeobius chitinivorans]RQH01807.1 hypothetical protein EA472_05675 [Natrarchaeobius chitinivorans]
MIACKPSPQPFSTENSHIGPLLELFDGIAYVTETTATPRILPPTGTFFGLNPFGNPLDDATFARLVELGSYVLFPVPETVAQRIRTLVTIEFEVYWNPYIICLELLVDFVGEVHDLTVLRLAETILRFVFDLLVRKWM